MTGENHDGSYVVVPPYPRRRKARAGLASVTQLDKIRQHHPLLEEALKFKAEKGEVSIRSLQRKFKIGYPRAARLIELIEAANEP